MTENPILKKLQLKSGMRAIVLAAPERYRPVLAALPEGVELAESLDGTFDFIHYFATEKAEAERKAPDTSTPRCRSPREGWRTPYQLRRAARRAAPRAPRDRGRPASSELL